LLTLVKRFFNWAIHHHVYGLAASPGDRLHASRIISPAPSRSRRLSDAELFAFWRATGRMEYPVGLLYRLLLLTGLWLNEAARLSWSEIHGDTIVIPAARMKGRDATAREHPAPSSGRNVAALSRRGPR
jgi:integrase